jgi:hypothetical protein
MNGNDLSVKTPRRMVICSQTRRTGEDRPDGHSALLLLSAFPIQTDLTRPDS